MAKSSVVIAGAGLGGLLLAQGLLQANIPFRLFERDAALDSRSQGYRLRLRQEACEAIQRLVPADLFQRIQDTAAHNFPAGHIRSAETGEAQESLHAAASRQTSVPLAFGGLNLLIDRGILRKLLYTGIESHVTFGKSVESYTSQQDTVTVHFADGSSASGSLLVAADGKNSAIMRQLRGGQSADIDSGLRFYYGKMPITESARKEVNNAYLEGFQITHEKYGESIGPTVTSEPAVFSHKGEPRVEDYLYFAFQGYDDELGTAPIKGGEEGKRFLLDRSSGYHPSVRAMFEHCDPAQLTGFRFLTADPRGIPAWPTTPRVTAIGDAVHAMPPTGAFGGTATLVDAAELTELLKKGWTQRNTATWAISSDELSNFEADLRERGTKMLNLAITRGSLFRLRPVA